ncbi:MAG: LysR family transcriptional regulator [Pseudomonadota bacterium]
MGQLEDMQMFVRIVEAGGISKTAEHLNIAKSAVSRRLTDLEKRLDTQLLRRTTRTSSLTEAGNQYYKRARNILDEVAELNEQTRGVKTHIEGTLKITTPLSFGLMHLSPLLDEFANQYPDVDFQINFTDSHIDLVEEGFEMAIRIGHLQNSSHQARRITEIKHMLCASESYLNKFGTPQSPKDLKHHSFLLYGLFSSHQLKLTDKTGKAYSVPITAKISANNGDFLKNMAVQGHGMTYLPTFITYKELANRQLIPILTEYQLPVMHAYAVYPKNRFLPQRCRFLIDFIVEKLGDSPYWDNH